DVLMVCTQRDLRGVQLALVRHDDAHFLDGVVVLVQLLEAEMGERAHVGAELAVAGSQMDLHESLARATPARGGAASMRFRPRAGAAGRAGFAAVRGTWPRSGARSAAPSRGAARRCAGRTAVPSCPHRQSDP